MDDPQAMDGSYVLGHEERELERLVAQAAFYRPLTASFLARAGIGPGMRVLDVGAGMGDVAFLIAERVGPTGAVVGVDRAAAAVARARRRAEAAGLANVLFVESALEHYAPAEPFDAVVGRLFLIHHPDPAAAVKQAAAHVRPGGVVAFQELELAARGMCWPGGALFSRVWTWMFLTCEKAGMNTHMGTKLLPILREAGLVGAEGTIEGRLGDGPDSPVYAFAAETLRTLLPVAERLGVVTAAEVDIDTLADRMRAEAVEAGAVIVPSLLAGAWARTPRSVLQR